MIEETYVSYKTARMLKEKGFKMPCSMQYILNGTQLCEKDKAKYYSDIGVDACTLQMAIAWLMGKGILLWVYPVIPRKCVNTSKFVWMWDGKKQRHDALHFGQKHVYDTYEEAIEAAIQYTLENFIKTMTTEEKAKTYDEILVKAKELRDANSSDNDIQRWIDNTFPELAEREDEKIRKHIIKILDSLTPCHWDGNEKRECLAWLEKQGEKDVRYKYLDDLLAADGIYQMAMNDDMIEEAKKKAISGLSKMEISKILGLEKQGKQKPVDWSEEDEKIWQDTIQLLEMANHPQRAHIDGKELDFTRNINLLKSLHPHKHWKPSQEQIDALLFAEGFVRGHCAEEIADVLKSLYEQLQAL